MAAGGPVHNYKFRIIHRYSNNMYELQKRNFFGWKTIARDFSEFKLDMVADEIRKRNISNYRIIKEFD